MLCNPALSTRWVAELKSLGTNGLVSYCSAEILQNPPPMQKGLPTLEALDMYGLSQLEYRAECLKKALEPSELGPILVPNAVTCPGTKIRKGNRCPAHHLPASGGLNQVSTSLCNNYSVKGAKNVAAFPRCHKPLPGLMRHFQDG